MVNTQRFIKMVRTTKTNKPKTMFSKIIGAELGYGPNTFANWENGQNDMPLFAFLNILEYFDMKHLSIEQLEVMCNE